jgi:hypothetical protein
MDDASKQAQIFPTGITIDFRNVENSFGTRKNHCVFDV